MQTRDEQVEPDYCASITFKDSEFCVAQVKYVYYKIHANTLSHLRLELIINISSFLILGLTNSWLLVIWSESLPYPAYNTRSVLRIYVFQMFF